MCYIKGLEHTVNKELGRKVKISDSLTKHVIFLINTTDLQIAYSKNQTR